LGALGFFMRRKKAGTGRNWKLLAVLALVAAALLAAAWWFSQQNPAAQAPTTLSAGSFGCPDCNIVFIGMTNVRADHMGAYGYYRNTTPNIDALARKSVVFDSAFASSSWTLPSATSILTSLYPLQHKLMNRAVFNDSAASGKLQVDPATGAPVQVIPIAHPIAPLDANITTLMDVLAANNYTTAAFTGGFDFDPSYGVTSRFDANRYTVDNESLLTLGGIRGLNLNYGSFNYSSAAFLDWVAKNRDERFFAYVQGFDAHCPFSYPEENREFAGNLSSDFDFGRCYWTFDRAEQVTISNKTYYPLTTTYDEPNPNGTPAATQSLPQFLFSQEDVDYMVALYDGEIKLVDGYVGRILAQLEREGILNRTIVVIFSEHGDIFGKHGRFMRGGPLRGTFYDDVLRVPLIVYDPRLKASGQRRSALVSTVDFAPTMLDMLSVPAPSQFVGMSLRQPILSDSVVRDAVFAASAFLPPDSNAFYPNSTFIGAVRTRDSKLIAEYVFNSRYETQKWLAGDYGALAANALDSSTELYDISSDPQELVNIAPSNPAETEKLKAMLFSWIKTAGN
jgi:arylsulfatase A-like enzyme